MKLLQIKITITKYIYDNIFQQKNTARTTSAHPTDSSIALTLHQPLYPPGRIIHIVRHHPKREE